MEDLTDTLITILICLFTYIFYNAWKTNQYWKEVHIPYVKPHLFLGNIYPVISGKMTTAELLHNICNQHPDQPWVGYYDMLNPAVLVQDVELIEKILIKDFQCFINRGLITNDKRNPLDSNLVLMGGNRWKTVRSKFSPIFSTGKLKSMFETMSVCGDELIKKIDKGPNQDLEIKDVLNCYAMDIMGSCVFGIEARNLSQPDSEFRRLGNKVLQMDFKTLIKIITMSQFPKLASFLNLTFSKAEVVEYFAKIIKDTLQHRRENNYHRNDFIQLMMQLQDKGFIDMKSMDPADDYLNINDKSRGTDKFELTDEQLIGHAVSFLTGGFDSLTISVLLLLYELAINPKIQEKVRQEILREIKNDGSLSHNALKEMHYLEQCAKETLRKYPGAQTLIRKCNREYTLPNYYVMKPGDTLYVSINSVHYNTKYYPEPDKFIPERFNPGNAIPACAYLPFGAGPRICIAMRFALLEMKFSIAKLLMNYKVDLSPKTKQPLEFGTINFISAPKNKLYFNFTKLE